MDESNDNHLRLPVPPPPGSGPTTLPFSKAIPLACGAAMGLVLRILFSGWVFGGVLLPDVMSAAFIFGTPIVVGAVTVLLAERIERRTWGYYLFAPWIAVLLFVAGTAVTLLEGSICIAMALPVFLTLGSLGGLAAGIAVRTLTRSSQSLSTVALLPLVLAGIESGFDQPDWLGHVESHIEIAAPAAAVWQQLNGVPHIAPAEIEDTWAYRIGIPRPLAGITTEPAVGGVRLSRWEKGVHFRERITDWQPQQYLRWTYEFDADSFPRGALDDHVLIGGRYFDLRSTSYRLEPHAGGTRLTIRTDYRVTTGFNWYSNAIARLVLEEMSGSILVMYRARAEAAAPGSSRLASGNDGNIDASAFQ